MSVADAQRDEPAEQDSAGHGSEGLGLFDQAARLDHELPDVDWTVLPPGVSRVHFASPSGGLAGIQQGNPANPRVVLVPGATGSKEDFLLMLAPLANAGYFVQSYDLAGQYQSAAAGPERLTPPRRRYDWDLFVDDFVAVLEAGATPAHVLGYSFAGMVAQLAFARRPELFGSLTLLSCPPESGQSFRGMKRVGWVTGVGPHRFGASLMIWGIQLNVTKVPPGRLRFASQRLRVTRRSSVDDIIGLMRDAPCGEEALASANLPKLVAVGEHDLWPLEMHRDFAGRLGAQFASYPAGHSPCESSPHQLSRDLVSLFRSTTG